LQETFYASICLQIVSPEEQANRMRMIEMKKELQRQQEMKMAMAVIMRNVKRERSETISHGQISPHPHQMQTSFY
jgi:hypothetical protein